mmetsp:Transcript_4729/g.8085  ORF Transcript_4729/g.8085 Transcript_4729/m.8085 type:complete len:212 (+) Transcript_4729:40-675(+)
MRHLPVVNAALDAVHGAQADEPVRVHDPQEVVLELCRVQLGGLRLVEVVVADGHIGLGHVEPKHVHLLAHLQEKGDPDKSGGCGLRALPRDVEVLHALHQCLVVGDQRDQHLRRQQVQRLFGILLAQHTVVVVALRAPQQRDGRLRLLGRSLLLARHCGCCLLQHRIRRLAVEEAEGGLRACKLFEGFGRRGVEAKHDVVLVDHRPRPRAQ